MPADPDSRYSRWLWEALKVVGAAAIATIMALQVSITRHAEQMEVMRRDIEQFRNDLKEHAIRAEHDRSINREKLEQLRETLNRHHTETISDELLRLRRAQEQRSLKQP